MKADLQGLAAAHRKAHDRAVAPTRGQAILRLDKRDDVL